jgi:hypothetical protein
MKVIIGAATAILAVVASTVVIPAATAADTAPACSATSGVTVIVDFTHFGGNIERGCAPGRPANALIALRAAGFSTAGTVQYGDAFVCRIDGLPTPKQDSCAVTPPPSAFWAYWNARPTDSDWTYSSLGVLAYRPKPGTIEAFAFGARARPGISPSAAIPPTPTTRPTTTTTRPPPTTQPPPATAATVPVAPPTTGPPVVAPESTTTTTATTTTATTTTTTTKRRSPTTTTRPATSTSTTVGIVERSASGPVGRDSSGSPAGVILGIVIVGGLALGAFAFTRARRRPA